MKKLSITLALAFAGVLSMQGQLVKEMFNTASEPSSGYSTYRTYGLQDVAWFVAQTPYTAGATPPPNPSSYVRAVSQNAASMWWNPHPTAIPNAGWITFPNTCPSSIPAYHGCLSDPNSQWGVDQWYKLSFFLCCEEDFCLDLTMWADNKVQEVYVNTVSNSGPGYWQNTVGLPKSYLGYQFSAGVSKVFCGDFHRGMNYIIIHVTSYNSNNSDYAGLLVNTNNITECYGTVINLLEEQDLSGRAANAGNSGELLDSPANTTTKKVSLGQNIPNPFDQNSSITYDITKDFKEAYIVFKDMDGHEIKTITISKKGPGAVDVPSSDLRQGIYSYQLIVDGQVMEAKKLIKQ